MSTLQGLRQQFFRDISGGASTYNGDQIAAAETVTGRTGLEVSEALQDLLGALGADGVTGYNARCAEYGRITGQDNFHSADTFPVLAYDFTGGTGHGLTVSRDSVAWYLDADGLLKQRAADKAVYEYDASGNSLGIRAEPAATNLLTQTEDLSHDDWNTGAVDVTANQATAPDGNDTADLVAHRDSGGSFDLISQAPSVSSSTAYTAQLRVENNDSTKSRLRLHDGSSNIATVDITWSGKSITGMSKVGTADDWGYSALPNDQYMIWWTGTTGGSASGLTYQFEPDDAEDGRGVYCWGAQLIAGAVPSSYIRSTTSSGSRAADVISKSLASGSALTAVVTARTGYGAGVVWSWDDGTANERVYVEREGDNTIHVKVVDGGSEVADLDLGAVADLTDFKVAFRVAANDVAASLDNGTAETDTSASVPTLTTVHFGCDYDGASQFGGHIKRSVVFGASLDVALL